MPSHDLMLTNFQWLCAAVLIAALLLRSSGLKRDFYAVERLWVMHGVGGGVGDVIRLESSHSSNYLIFDIVAEGEGCSIRQKQHRELFARKTFEVFNDYAAAKARFDIIDALQLSNRIEGCDAQRIFLWAVTESNRRAVHRRLLKGAQNVRKLAEINYTALLKCTAS